jgi:DNA-binding IclR family transcriptional regulator
MRANAAADVFAADSTVTEHASILSKAFAVLRAFNPNRRTMTLSEISRSSGLAKSTVHRLLERLIELDAIEQFPDGYAISLSFVQLGATTPAASGRDAAMPYLAYLHRTTGLPVHYGVLRELEVVILARLTGPQRRATVFDVGTRVPAHCTAIGKAMLAWADAAELDRLLRRRPLVGRTQHSITDPDCLLVELAAARANGLAYDRAEGFLAVSSVAAPVVVSGFAVGAISITHPADVPLEEHTLHALRDASERLCGDFAVGLSGRRERWFPHDIR